ncbi:MAG: hypothetical protein HQL87_08535 [Magnetococcales bacterium]|nr:hypothetical protein [Magnetococcales bacterium]
MDLSGQQQVSTIQQQQIVFSAMTPEAVTHPEAVFPVLEKTAQTSHATANVLGSPLLLLEARMNSMSSTIVQWKNKATALQATVTACEAQIANMQQEIVSMEQQIAELLSANQLMDDKLIEKDQTIADCDAKIAALELEVADTTTTTQQLQQLSASNNQLLYKTRELEKTISDHEAYVALMEQENVELKQKVDQFSSSNDQLLGGLNSMLARFAVDDDADGCLAPPSASTSFGLLSETVGNA